MTCDEQLGNWHARNRSDSKAIATVDIDEECGGWAKWRVEVRWKVDIDGTVGGGREGRCVAEAKA